jgi:hypothetical protein
VVRKVGEGYGAEVYVLCSSLNRYVHSISLQAIVLNNNIDSIFSRVLFLNVGRHSVIVCSLSVEVPVNVSLRLGENEARG